jgi:hypothetical protein
MQYYNQAFRYFIHNGKRFFFLEKVTANYYVIAIGISEANPLAESVDSFFPVHYVLSGRWFEETR